MNRLQSGAIAGGGKTQPHRGSMIAICFKLIASLICCAALIFAQKSLSTEITSQTPNDHVVHEIANLIETKATSNYGWTPATTAASLHNFGNASIDQRGRTLTDGRDQFIVTVVGTGSPGYYGNNIAAISAKIDQVRGFAVDGIGNIYFADSGLSDSGNGPV